MSVLEGVTLVIACAPLALLTFALAGAVYSSWTHQDDDDDHVR